MRGVPVSGKHRGDVKVMLFTAYLLNIAVYRLAVLAVSKLSTRHKLFCLRAYIATMLYYHVARC